MCSSNDPAPMQPPEEKPREIYLDKSLESYRSFYDHAWARRFSQLTERTAIDSPAFDLCIGWKSAANTHQMPWLLVQSLHWQIDGYSRKHDTYAEMVVDTLEARLLTRVSRDLPEAARKKLSREIRKLSDAAIQARNEARRQMSTEMSAEVHWAALLGETEFQLSVWGAQRLCYGAIYHAYENFTRQCVAAATGSSADWRPGGELVQLAQGAFGETVVSQCFSSVGITVARHVRNALAHHGGRVTKELAGIRHNIQLIDGMLQISASDTRNLFDQLKEPAYSLGQATLEVIVRTGTPGQR